MTESEGAGVSPATPVGGDQPPAAPTVPDIPPRVLCRPLGFDDRAAMVGLLAAGFPSRSAAFWATALERLERHSRAQEFTQLGYGLFAGGILVGNLLTIFRRLGSGRSPKIRCNLSSWCVQPAYRSYAPLLVKMATRDPNITYTNISPEQSTRPTVEAQGFVRYAGGLAFTVPLLAAGSDKAVVRLADDAPPSGASADDIGLMQDHAALSCLRAWCVTADRAFPLIFTAMRHGRGLLPVAYALYCPDPDLLARYARPIGRFLLRRGFAVMSFDAEVRPYGLPGLFRTGRTPKYFKGPDRPRLVDLAYSELPMFGL